MKKTSKRKVNSKKGSILAFVLIMIVIIAITLTSLLTYISSQLSFSKDRVEREKAFQIAEAGVYYYRWYLAHQVAGKTALQIKDFWENGSPLGVGEPYPEIEYSDPEGGAIGKYKLEVEEPAPGSTIVYVKSTGWTYQKPSVKREIRVRFRRPSWSENSVLANDEMRFGDGTTVTGKMHSNEGIRFDGVANNIVSSSLASYDDPDHGGAVEFGVHTHVNAPPASGINDAQRPLEAPPNVVAQRTDVFQAGRTFPAPQMDFNALVSDLAFMRSEATIKYDNSGVGRRIILKADGTMDVCKANSYSEILDANYSSATGNANAIEDYSGVVTGATGSNAWRNGDLCVNTIAKGGCCALASCGWIQNSNHSRGKCVTLTNQIIPNNGIVYVANNLWLEGTISNKRVSFVAAELSDEPVGGGVSNTGGKKNIFLGMNNLLYTNIDGSDIIGLIAQDNITIVRDSLNVLVIDGALLAKEGRVGRCYYDGTVKNSITINGSVATNVRYGFAYTNGTGYQIRNLNFDNNLLYYPPPYFPTGTEYAIDLWDEL